MSTFWTFLDRMSGTYYDHISSSSMHPNEFIYQRAKMNRTELDPEKFYPIRSLSYRSTKQRKAM